MATFSVAKSVFSPLAGRFASVVYSGPADFLSGYTHTDAPLLEDAFSPTDTPSGALTLVSLTSDTLSLTDTISGDFIISLTETWGAISDTLDAVLVWNGVSFAETLTITDTLGTPVVTGELAETLVWTDIPGGKLAISSTLTDTWGFTEALRGHQIGVLSDTLSITDALAGIHLPATFDEPLSWADTLTGKLVLSTASSDSFTWADSLSGLLSPPLADSLTWTDIPSGKIQASGVLTDSATLSETLTGQLLLYGALSDTAGWTDTLSGSLTLLGVFSDSLVWGDTLDSSAAQRVLAINAETGAVSEYVFTPTIQGIGSWRNQLYLSTADGLYALDNDTDDGTAIDWEFRSGFSHLGTDRLKRLLDVNVLARGTGEVFLVLVADRHGQKQERRYQLVKLTADALRDQVIHAGRGIDSVYWQAGIQGAGPAEISELRLQPDVLSRRR